MKFSKQILLSMTLMIGGSVLLYATVQQILRNDNAATDLPAPPPNQVSVNASQQSNQPLTVDVATEKNLLIEKQRQREAQVAAQERAAQQYLNEQQRIEAAALARSRAENERYIQRAARDVGDVPTNHSNSDTPVDDNGETDNTDAQPATRPKPTLDPTPIVRPVVTARPVETVEPVVKPKSTPSNSTEPVQATNNKSSAKSATQTQTSAQSKAQSNAATAKSTEKPAVAKPRADKQTAEKITAPSTATADSNRNPKTNHNANAVRPDQHQVKAGEGLISLARRYDIPTTALAAANDLSPNSQLRVGQTLKIPSPAQVQRLKREAEQEQARKQKEAEQKKQQQAQFANAQQKLREARRNVKEADDQGNFGVQVALAADDARADAIVKELQAAGYKVKTSQTSRGVRVVVGPETGKEAALALKDKINADPRVSTKNGWVLNW